MREEKECLYKEEMVKKNTVEIREKWKTERNLRGKEFISEYMVIVCDLLSYFWFEKELFLLEKIFLISDICLLLMFLRTFENPGQLSIHL